MTSANNSDMYLNKKKKFYYFDLKKNFNLQDVDKTEIEQNNLIKRKNMLYLNLLKNTSKYFLNKTKP